MFCFRLIISYYCGKTLHVQYPVNFEIFQSGGWEHAHDCPCAEALPCHTQSSKWFSLTSGTYTGQYAAKCLRGSSLIIWNSLSVPSNALFYAKLDLKHKFTIKMLMCLHYQWYISHSGKNYKVYIMFKGQFSYNSQVISNHFGSKHVKYCFKRSKFSM